jgi:DNA-directed RNA polymerase subunit K/omega
MKYTRFEVARIIGARALQLALGAPPLLKNVEGKSPVEIAKLEFEKKVIPITVKRRMPRRVE